MRKESLMRSLLSGAHSQNGKGWWGEAAEEKQHQQLETDLGARDCLPSEHLRPQDSGGM